MDDETMEVRTTQLTLVPRGESLYHENAIEITISDEASGEYVIVRGKSDKIGLGNTLEIDPDEWPTLRKAIDHMMGQCRTNEEIDAGITRGEVWEG